MAFVARLKSTAVAGWRGALVVAAGVVLVALTGWTLARFVWLVVEGPQRPVVQSSQSVPGVSRPVYTPEMARNWRLFGDAAAVPTQTDQAADAPDTRLSLQLLGTFSTRDEKRAGAVIAERGRDGELYRVGAAVPGGATLEKVESDRVLLRRRGQLETLRFEVLAVASAGTGDAAVPAASDGDGADMATGFRRLRDRMSQPQGQPASGGADLVNRLQEDIRTNPEGVLEELGLKAAGSGSGYMVGSGTNAEAMRGMGLRPGDVILSVNGSPLGDVASDSQLVDQVKASGEARVEIRRGSQTFTVNYPL
ncbi:MAG: type II secretion system protein N [Gammaproteobacteria bacterium]